MKNVNYDLVKLLHSKLDNAWRLEKYYLADAKEVKCHSAPALEKILEEEKRHINMLKDEIKLRIEAGIFD
jgi:hypothetical protein